MTISRGYSNVFEALEDNPGMAQNLKIRSELMISLRKYIEEEGLGQKKAAEVSGVHQPRISDLMRGKINKFTTRIPARSHVTGRWLRLLRLMFFS